MSEIVPVRPTFEMLMQAAAPVINAQYDLTNIYNKHATAEHAAQTASQIEPGSLVFLEGTHESFEPLPEGDLYSNVGRVSLQGIFRGKDDAVYQRNKQVLLEDLGENLAVGAEEVGQYPDFSHTIRRKLLEKDCTVIIADADLSQIPEHFQTSEFLEQYQSGFAHLGHTTQILLNGESAVKRYDESLRAYHSYVAAQHLRETISVGRTATWLLKLAQNQYLYRNAPMNELHKFRAYTVWGTNHAASLTGVYRGNGINARQSVIDASAEPNRYIPPHDADIRELARKNILADAAATAINLSWHATEDWFYAADIYREVRASSGKEAIHAYIDMANLLKIMMQRRGMLRVGYKYGVPDPEIEAEYDTDVHNLGNLLLRIGVDANKYLAYPYAPWKPQVT